MRSYPDIEYKNGLDMELFLPDGEEFSLFVYFTAADLWQAQRVAARFLQKRFAVRV